MRKKRRRRGGAMAAVFFVLTIVFMIISGLLFAARYKESKKPVYEYVSMVDEASAKAFVWLSQIDDNGLTYEDVKACMGEFNLEIVKTPAKDKGVYDVQIVDGSYDYCVAQAETGLEKAYKMAVCKRLLTSGYEGEISDETVETLMKEAYEVSVSDYIREQNITLIPEYDELSAKIIAEKSKDIVREEEHNEEGK